MNARWNTPWNVCYTWGNKKFMKKTFFDGISSTCFKTTKFWKTCFFGPFSSPLDANEIDVYIFYRKIFFIPSGKSSSQFFNYFYKICSDNDFITIQIINDFMQDHLFTYLCHLAVVDDLYIVMICVRVKVRVWRISKELEFEGIRQSTYSSLIIS